MDIRQRLQPAEIYREVVSHENYGDRMQLLARDVLAELERLSLYLQHTPACALTIFRQQRARTEFDRARALRNDRRADPGSQRAAQNLAGGSHCIRL